jgi:hypothetical protein
VANTVDILQGGKSGIATIDQRDGGYNHARIEQTGGGADATIEQSSEVGDHASIKESDAARSRIHSEYGGNNTNTIVQSGANAPHYAQINQSYATNDTTTIIQTGTQYNEAYVDQIRSSNDTALLIQDGDINKAAARQHHGSGNTVAQVGAHSKMDLTQQAAFESRCWPVSSAATTTSRHRSREEGRSDDRAGRRPQQREQLGSTVSTCSRSTCCPLRVTSSSGVQSPVGVCLVDTSTS